MCVCVFDAAVKSYQSCLHDGSCSRVGCRCSDMHEMMKQRS